MHVAIRGQGNEWLQNEAAADCAMRYYRSDLKETTDEKADWAMTNRILHNNAAAWAILAIIVLTPAWAVAVAILSA